MTTSDVDESRPLTIRLERVHLAGDFYPLQQCLLAYRGGHLVGRVYVLLTGSASAVAGYRLGDDADARLDDALLRYGIGRLKVELAQARGAERFFELLHDHEWKIDAEHLDEVIGPATWEKQCRYQALEGQDLFCLASGRGDESAIGAVGYQQVAPTSRALCRECNLPDERYRCSKLVHPQVIGLAYFGSSLRREIREAWCDDGRSEVANPGGCHLGGHECWQLEVRSEPDL